MKRTKQQKNTLVVIQLTDSELASDVEDFMRQQTFLFRFRQELLWCAQIHTGIPQGDLDADTYFKSLQAFFSSEELQALANSVLETINEQ